MPLSANIGSGESASEMRARSILTHYYNIGGRLTPKIVLGKIIVAFPRPKQFIPAAQLVCPGILYAVAVCPPASEQSGGRQALPDDGRTVRAGKAVRARYGRASPVCALPLARASISLNASKIFWI